MILFLHSKVLHLSSLWHKMGEPYPLMPMITNLAGAPSAQLQMKMHITQCDINIVKPQQCADMYVAADRHAPEQAQTHFSRQMQQLNFPAFSNSPILATTHADFGRHSCLTVRLHVRTVTIDYGCSHRRAPRS